MKPGTKTEKIVISPDKKKKAFQNNMRLFPFPTPIVLSFLLAFLSLFFPFSSASYQFRSSPDTRVAICLVGGLRAFELTAETLKTNLFPLYPNADIFVVTPRDKDAWKIYLLQGSNVVAAEIKEQHDLFIDEKAEAVIHEQASLDGRQGLMKYLALLQACKRLVEHYEILHGFRYDWILRTRPDTIWQPSPPPSSGEPVQFFSNQSFYIPPGSDWYGVNDRFTLGDRNSSLLSLSGLSSMGLHYKRRETKLTSEDKFNKLLSLHGILSRVVRPHFPFCVLTKRAFPFPPKRIYDGRAAPLGSPSARDGAYCWPCEGETDPNLLKQIPMKGLGMTEFCNTGSPYEWPSNWIRLFKKAVGINGIRALRNFLREKDRASCLKNVNTFIKGVYLRYGKFTPTNLCNKEFPQIKISSFIFIENTKK